MEFLIFPIHKEKTNGKKKKYGKNVDTMCLPTSYSTGVPPLPELCNDCFNLLEDNGGEADTFSENDGLKEESQDLENDIEEYKDIQERDINLQVALEDIDKW
ncbi:hypothetical protein C1646_674802 [Rhizophagus diaphanus]|nr:hypothetical protein C1646_674802 [Rhizophagus diaphanus] [Rhizophagus sp. MUCL 43196]